MNEAKKRNGKNRSVRDGLLQYYTASDCFASADNAGLLRLAEARNSASKSANIFMIVAATISGLYFLRLEGLAGQIKIGTYDLSALPFGAFVLCIASLVTSTVSFVRTGDSRAYDRQLRLASEHKMDDGGLPSYFHFPNEHGWGEPLSNAAYAARAGRISGFFRSLSIIQINLFLMILVIAPLISGVDFLINGRASLDTAFQVERKILVAFLLMANAFTFYLVVWVRMIDRD